MEPTNRSKTQNIVQNFHQQMPSRNMSKQDRIFIARPEDEHSKIAQEYLLKNSEPPVCDYNRYNHYQRTTYSTYAEDTSIN